MTELQTFSPDWVSPPGETIHDLLAERSWTQKEFAERMDVTQKHVGDLVGGRASISADMAERLERTLGAPATFWLNREARYRQALEHRAQLDALASHSDWLKSLPLNWLTRNQLVRKCSHKGQQVLECLRFFDVASVDAFHAHFGGRYGVAFRESGAFNKEFPAVVTWVHLVERRAQEIRTAPFCARTLKETLPALRALTLETDPRKFVPELQRLCAAAGVAIVIEPTPPKCPVHGFARWQESKRALVGLSLRYLRNDLLWFAFFHEVGHLLLHGKRMVFLENIKGLPPEVEADADRFAANTLIPPSAAKRLAALRSADDIVAFAEEIGIHPGIVVGRLQHEKLVPFNHHNNLKAKYKWEVYRKEDGP